MEQQFQLKHYGKLSLFEQAEMTSEDRAWWMQRLQKEAKDRQERERQQAGSLPRVRKPPTVSRPSVPRIPRR